MRETSIALGGDGGTPARDVARAYVECVEGDITGRNCECYHKDR
ncbi:hypothetical protein [Saccharothrix deserti]|nr:hypothetical protein [Saccharothrix deserti]